MSDEIDSMIEGSLLEIEEMKKETEKRVNTPLLKWETYVVLLTIVWTVFGIFGALLSSFSADDAMKSHIQEVVSWNSYQSETTQYEILKSKYEILGYMGKNISKSDEKQLKDYEKKIEADKKGSIESEHSAEKFILTHHIIGTAIIMFQLAIALGAIALIVKKKKLWLFGFVFGFFGIILVSLGSYDFFFS